MSDKSDSEMGSTPTIGGKKVVTRIGVDFGTVDLAAIGKQYNTPKEGPKLEGLTPYLRQDSELVQMYCDKLECGADKSTGTIADCQKCIEECFNPDGPVKLPHVIA